MLRIQNKKYHLDNHPNFLSQPADLFTRINPRHFVVALIMIMIMVHDRTRTMIKNHQNHSVIILGTANQLFPEACLA